MDFEIFFNNPNNIDRCGAFMTKGYFHLNIEFVLYSLVLKIDTFW